MKFLLIGCIHGIAPKKLKQKLNKKNFDVILCSGDLCNNDELRKLEFKYWKSAKNLEDIIGKKRVKKLIEKGIQSMVPALNFLASFKKQVIMVYGNHDYVKRSRGFKTKKKFLLELLRLKKYKNIALIKAGIVKINGYTLIANSGYRSATAKGANKDIDKKTMKKIRMMDKLWDLRLKKLFKYADKKTIMLVHDPPYRTLDKIKNKASPLVGRYLGDEYYRKYILKHNPLVCICAHMHENQGKFRLGKTLIINSGYGRKAQAAVLEVDEKLKVKFTR